MSDFTKELRHENYLILQTLKQAKQLTMRTLRGRRVLFDKRNDLITHLKREDEKIHAALQGAMQTHPDLEQTLAMFKNDIENTTESVIDFFKKYGTDDADKELSDDFDKLFATISKRIEKEENIFYAEFDEIEEENDLLRKAML
ncbi:hypothetical protein A9Q76_02025 [Arcobacter sp. 31_11_sub10_T18]|nr:hypothetical protein A9Q76_02025 [Arcobacter sp. 31_11_sub10_T18]